MNTSDTTISNGILTAVIKQHGAELCSLKDSNGREYMWQADPAHWGKHSPVLFPIVGRLKDDSYHHKGKSYRMTRHGFARDHAFEAYHKSDDKICFRLEHNEHTFEQYPFPFTLEIKYILKDGTLALVYEVQNTGTETMPFSIGAHPAFALPGNFNGYSLQFEQDEALNRYALREDLISDETQKVQTEKGRLKLNYDLFAEDALVFKGLASDHIDIVSPEGPFMSIQLGNCPHLGIWTKQDAPFICIEPWHGHADTTSSTGDIMSKAGITLLEPGRRFTCGFSIRILNS